MAPQCCYISTESLTHLTLEVPCRRRAEWEIVHGATTDDYTHACTEHVGKLLTDAPEHRIYPLDATDITARRADHETA